MKVVNSGSNITLQQGASLLEVLIAVLIVAIGLLGLAGLQTAGFNNTHISYLRSIASIHTENMAELMRANTAAVSSNIYTAGADASSIDYDAIDLEADLSPDCRTRFTGGGVCQPAEQALADAYFWRRNIARTLPGGVGNVICNDSDASDTDPCTDGSPMTIYVSWQEQDYELVKSGTKTFSTVVRP